ncbi:MAG TPA: 2OG-Fe(II) oxygenase [Steroidobacteraceae bacterium]|nr:2OG-Fe(II) oxygenase [Steroidobacteraceae bacterium]
MNVVADRVKNGESTDIATLLRSRLKIPGSLESLRARYADAKPFPHLVLDNLFPDEVLDAVVAESPQLNRDNWLFIEADGLQQVLRMRTSVDMGPASYQLAAFVHSPAFLYLLSELTGVWQLLPDPYLQGAGHAAMRRGMFMEVHSDRNVAYDTGLTRRLAMIIFLNRDWKSEYAGQLELWNHQGTGREVSIEPLFNRTVLFEVADPNYHGVPAPLNCPENRARHSFIVYFHTVGGKDGNHPSPHTSVFAPRAYEKRSRTLRKVIKNITPPFLLRAAKRVLGRGR